eukprot:g10884.t1
MCLPKLLLKENRLEHPPQTVPCIGDSCCVGSTCMNLPGLGCKASRGRTQCVGSSALSMKEGVCQLPPEQQKDFLPPSPPPSVIQHVGGEGGATPSGGGIPVVPIAIGLVVANVLIWGAIWCIKKKRNGYSNYSSDEEDTAPLAKDHRRSLDQLFICFDPLEFPIPEIRVEDINYNKVVAALEQVGLESAMRILKDLEDQAAGVADPNEFILSSLKKPVGPTGGEGWRLGVDRPTAHLLEGLELFWQALNKFIHFVSKGGRSVQPSEVADALDALGPARVMRILKDMEEHGLGLDDPVSYVKAAAKMSGHLVVKKEVDSFESEDHSVDDVSKLTSRMKWLNEFGGLSKKIAIDEVIGALYCLGLAPSMSILRSLQDGRAKEEVPADEVEDWLAWAADEEPKLKRQKRMTSGASAGPKEPSVSHPLSPQEKVMQVRSYALKNSLRLDDQCLKTLSRLPCSKATDLIDEVLRGGRNRRGVANPSKYLLRAVQMSCVGLGLKPSLCGNGLAMELAVSLGLVLNNDALDELASIPRKASHAIIRQLAASPNRVSPMDFICEEVEKCRTQLRWQSQ